MSFIANLFHHEKKSESVILIDVGVGSVAGAYALYTEGETPLLLYTCRLFVEMRQSESKEDAMIHRLQTLGETLIREGAPVLARTTGSGSANTILVSINAPWKETVVHFERFEEKDPFMFTKKMVDASLEKTTIVPTGKFLANESIIGAILNGYETRDPYGKKAHRAEVVVLTSLIDTEIVNRVVATLRGLYHSTPVLPIGGDSIHYQAMRAAFPHERDALIFDATGSLTSIALVRRDLFVATLEVPDSAPQSDGWIGTIVDELTILAKQYPLPRTIFLIAQASDVDQLRQTLGTADLGKLWLSDNPPKIVSVLASHLAPLMRQSTIEAPDLSLLLMALYWYHRATRA